MNRGLSVAGTCILGAVALIGIGPASGQEPKKARRRRPPRLRWSRPGRGRRRRSRSLTVRASTAGGTWIALVGPEWAIVGKNTEPVPVSTYLLTKAKYSDFRLTATVKLVESEMHSGIAFWGRIAPERKDPYTYAGHLVMFPRAGACTTSTAVTDWASMPPRQEGRQPA